MTIKHSDRYLVSEAEDYEKGSNNQVLKNRLGIKSKIIMDQLEARELEKAQLVIFKKFDESYQFSVKDICYLHKVWLNHIYFFAGKFRSVNLSKDNFSFASANRISTCMKKFEKDYLSRYTPCHFTDIDKLAWALSVVHVEFILIHPFREGNGRLGRLLSILMALQANQPPLDFSPIDQTINARGFKDYIAAIQSGLSGDYKPMQVIFKKIIEISKE